MSTSQGVQRPGSRLRSIAGAALAALGVLVAVGVGALMITSLRAYLNRWALVWRRGLS